jgi:hypothetical protein
MYNILEQAIIDAKALREAALKNAETAVLEKYSDEVKGAIDVMLEAEMGPPGFPEEEIIAPEEEAAEPALAAAEGENLCGCPDAEEQVEWELSLDDLKAMSDAMPEGEPMEQDALAAEFGAEEEEEELMFESEELDEEIDLVFEEEELEEGWKEKAAEFAAKDKEEEEAEFYGLKKKAPREKEEDEPKGLRGTGTRASTESPSAFKTKFEEGLDEDIELDEDMVREIVEELVVDISPQKSGWAGTPAAVMDRAEEMELARRSGTEAKEEIEALQDAGERLSVNESKKLEDENKKLKELIYALKGKLDESILSNAKLLYTNQTLTSASLNERQKNRIVESIQNADSVEEAKVIFETLQSTAGPSTRKAPKSLSEAIRRPSLNVPRRRRENSKHESVVKNRFQKLAGIKK